MGKTWKDKPAKHQKPKHRSPMPPPSRAHEDKRKKTRAQDRVDLQKERHEADDENRTDRLFTQNW